MLLLLPLVHDLYISRHKDNSSGNRIHCGNYNVVHGKEVKGEGSTCPLLAIHLSNSFFKSLDIIYL